MFVVDFLLVASDAHLFSLCAPSASCASAVIVVSRDCEEFEVNAAFFNHIL
jgi:hypothetical protein